MAQVRRGGGGAAELAWWLALVPTLLVLGWMLFLASGADGVNPYPRILMRVLDGRSGDQPWWEMAAVKTVGVVLGALGLSLVVGVVVGVMQVQPNAGLRVLGRLYVEVVRGIPIYVMLLFLYFGVRGLLKDVVPLGPFSCAVLGLGLCYAAYVGEVVRAGIQAIPPEEIEAGSLEGGRVAVMWFIVVPQAWRMMLPALANEGVALLKDSSLVGAVTLMDITRAADVHARASFEYFETFALLGLLYLLGGLVLTRVQRALE